MPYQTFRSGAASAIAIAIDEVYNTTFDHTTNFSSYKEKVLFISSEQSKDLGYNFQEKYQAPLFSNRDHVEIKGTGHSGLINCTTDQTLTLIKKYLDNL